jgi:hypothetical protein
MSVVRSIPGNNMQNAAIADEHQSELVAVSERERGRKAAMTEQ